jgi:hypothetical protein
MKNDEKHLFNNPKNIKGVLYTLYRCCVFLFALDYIFTSREDEGNPGKVSWSML